MIRKLLRSTLRAKIRRDYGRKMTGGAMRTMFHRVWEAREKWAWQKAWKEQKV